MTQVSDRLTTKAAGEAAQRQMGSEPVGLSALINGAAFALGPGAAAILIGWVVAMNPPEFAHPSQAAALQISVLAPLVALGALGVFVSIVSRMTPDPLAPQRIVASLRSGVLTGLVLGLAVLGLDLMTGFSSHVAHSLGIASIHIAFPVSVSVYFAGAIAVECLYRIIPMSLTYGVVARLFLKGRGEGIVFWVLAALTSLIEPLSQAGLAQGAPALVWVLFASIWLFNISEAALWRRYGWTSLIVSRVIFYLLWHVALGPVFANVS